MNKRTIITILSKRSFKSCLKKRSTSKYSYWKINIEQKKSLNNPLLIVFSCTIILHNSCTICSLLFVAIQHLSTKSMNKILISANIFQSKLLSWHSRYWLLKYWCKILLTIRTYCQEFFSLTTSQIYILTALKNVKPLIFLSIIFINY